MKSKQTPMKSKHFSDIKAQLKQAQHIKKLELESKMLSKSEPPAQGNETLTVESISYDKPANAVQDSLLFQQAIGKVKPIHVDTIAHINNNSKKKRITTPQSKKKNKSKSLAEFHFSDEFEPMLNTQGPMKYVRDGVDSFEVKNLRRGHYTPDLILDLHGLDQNQAKKELAALLYACQKEHAQCICIVHGIGSYILKNKVPHWLVQHPDVMAFHQAPLEWGGNGAILALIEIKDKFAK